MSTPDDDALTWAGDPDRETTNITWSAPKARKASTASDRRLSRPRSGRIETPVSRRKRDGFDTPTASATQPTTSANVELIVTAACAAAYLLVTVAWLIVALRNPLAIADPVGNAMFIVGLWAAVAAGPLVCGGVIVLAKHLSLARRSVLFILGLVVLIPWPYLGWAS
jgi:hypothetical protein